MDICMADKSAAGWQDLSGMAELMNTLLEDLRAALEENLVASKDRKRIDQRHARNLIRIFGALVDALAFHLKQRVLHLSKAGIAKLDSGRLSILEEANYDLRENGAVERRPRRLPFLPNFRFAFQEFFKFHGGTFALDVTGEDWKNFCCAVQLRNRMMHPRSAEDLKVERNELKRLLAAIEWFGTQTENAVSCMQTFSAKQARGGNAP